MIKKQWKIKPTFDRGLLIASVTLAIIMISVAIAALVFLSNNLFKAFVPEQAGEDSLKFDIEGYEQVLKDFNRTPSTTTQ